MSERALHLVWIWLYVQFLFPHFPHLRRSVLVPSTAASLLLSIPSLTNCSLCFFTSSLAISSLVIFASLWGVIMPSRKLERSMGFFLSFRLNTRDLIWFLYFWLVWLYKLNISLSNIVARSSHLKNNNPIEKDDWFSFPTCGSLSPLVSRHLV